jgi:hypothetical protein
MITILASYGVSTTLYSAHTELCLSDNLRLSFLGEFVKWLKTEAFVDKNRVNTKNMLQIRGFFPHEKKPLIHYLLIATPLGLAQDTDLVV